MATLGDVRDDLLRAVRQLPRDLQTWLSASLTLGLGIGANLALFLYLQPLLLASLPYPDPERLAYLWQTDENNGEPFAGVSIPDFRDFQQQAGAFSGLAAYARRPMAVRYGEDGGTERTTVLQASHELFAVLGLQPALGRGFVAEEDVVAAAPVAMLGHATWQQRFGGARAVLGQQVQVDGVTHRIVGVAPAASGAGLDADLWVPLLPAQAAFAAERGVHGIAVVGRLAPGQSLAAADGEVAAIATALEQAYPEENAGRGARVVSMHDHLVRDVRTPLLWLSMLTACVLLLACVNVAVLLFARASARTGELAVRAGLGATPGRLARMLAAEQALLGMFAGAAGVLVAAAALQLFAGWNPLSQRFVALAPRLGLEAVLGTFGVAMLLALAFGLVPALRLGRRAAVSLAASGRPGERPDTLRLRRLLVGVQAALAVLLLSGAGLMARSFASTVAVDPGFTQLDALRVGVSLPPDRYPFPGMQAYPRWPEVTLAQARMQEAVAALPFVEEVALGLNHPLEAGWTTQVERVARPLEGPPIEWRLRAVSPGYLEVAGVPLLAGRALNASDHATAAPVVVVNASAARAWFDGMDAVGQRIRSFGVERTIVGVVGDVHFDGTTQPVPPAFYPPLAQTPFSDFSLLVRLADAAPADARRRIEEAAWSVEPAAAMFGQATLGTLLDEQLAPRRFALDLVLAMALLALLLAVSGVHGVVANDVRRRRGEIAVRRALGASPGAVLALGARRAMAVVAAGAVAGAVVAWGAGHWLQSWLHGIQAGDPAALFGACALFLAAAAAAALGAARAATRVDPSAVLRES